MSQEINATMNEYLPLRDVVFQTLRQAILRGELEPGERLMEIHLADRLGVSRTPIREAIRKLELEGLVVMIPRRGAIVASITEKDLKDVLEVRRTLEMMAAEIACQRITPELLQELSDAGEELQKLQNSDDYQSGGGRCEVSRYHLRGYRQSASDQYPEQSPGADVSLSAGVPEGRGQP